LEPLVWGAAGVRADLAFDAARHELLTAMIGSGCGPQYHAPMAENGVIPWTREQAVELGERLRAVLAAG
jgi:hypothetical protein